MFDHILVPLDGSKPAESALPAAAWFARTFRSRLTLLHVIEEDAPATVHGEKHLRKPAEAEAYLEEVRRRICPSAEGIECHVHTAATRDVALAIVEHQHELAPDLIVMCTHGRSDLRRILAGSIAQQVVASGPIPVLLIRPPQEEFACDTVIAPVDADPVHEQGLAAAAALARAAGVRLELLSVAPTIHTLAGRNATLVRFMPGTTMAVLELSEKDLEEYLKKQVRRLRHSGIRAEAEVRRGDAAAVIAETAEAHEGGIVVLGTHGRSGTKAFWENSVGARVQARTRRPLLLVPVRKESREPGIGTSGTA